MMKSLKLLLIISIGLNASNLKDLLNFSLVNNDLVKSKSLQIESAKSSVAAVDKSYLPTVDIGAFAQNANPKNLMRAGTTYSLFAKLNYNIYDGGIKKYTLKQKQFELVSKVFEKEHFLKSLQLSIVQDYYAIKSLQALQLALIKKKNAITAQYAKVKKLNYAGMAPKDDVARLKAALEMVKYNIESLKFKKESLLSAIGLKVGKKITHIGNSHFVKKRVTFSKNAQIKAMLAKAMAVKNGSDAINCTNNLKINLGVDYNVYSYDRYDLMHPKGLKSQTKITLSANMRVFDGGVTKQKAQAVKLQAMSLILEAKHKTKEQKSNFKLAKLRIKSIRASIKSAKASLDAANSLYETVLQKYNAQIVENSLYLDALSNKVQALAEYKRSLNDLEIAYALYYYYSGKNIKGFIKWKNYF